MPGMQRKAASMHGASNPQAVEGLGYGRGTFSGHLPIVYSSRIRRRQQQGNVGRIIEVRILSKHNIQR
jgi:hypothetical protein